MNSLNSKLVVLLVIQLGLILIFNIWAGPKDEQYPKRELLSVDKTKVNKFVISQGDEIVKLNQQGDNWHVVSQENLPADQDKVNAILTKLNALSTSWPVATTKSSHERFELTKELNQRQVQLFYDDELAAQLFLGTSPGFRKVHVRVPDEDEVYSVALNAFDLSLKSDDWLDKSLLSSSEPTQIKGKDFNLIKKQESWSLAQADELGQKGELDLEKINQLASTMSSLKVQKIADELPEENAITIEIKQETDRLTYSFYQKEDKYYVSRNDFKTGFLIDKSTFEKVAEINPDSLYKSQLVENQESVMKESVMEESAMKENEVTKLSVIDKNGNT